MGQLRYRVRLRNLADTEDLFLATSVRNGTHPYIKAAPRQDGQEVDPISGRVTQGITVVEIIDWWGNLCLFPPAGYVIEDTVPASVEVAPASASVTEGGTGELSAIVRNAAGQRLVGQVVTWASDDTDFVTVGADSGDETHSVTYSGVTEGSANVTASVGALDSDPVPVTVGAISGDVYFADKWDSGDDSKSADGWSWQPSNSQVVAVAGPFGGDTFCLRHRHSPTSSNQEKRFVMGENLEGYYFGFYGKWPSNYVHDGPNYNKFWRAWSGNTADGNGGYSQYHVKGGFSTMVTTPTTQSRIRPEFGYRRADGSLSGVGDFQYSPTGNVLGTANTPLNSWVKVRGRVQLSSEKFINDGALQLWFNDVLVFSATDVDLYSRDPAANHFFNRGYVEGAANSGYDVQTDIYTTRFRWASTYEKADPSLSTDW